jgi:hypothetical protein
MSGNVSSELLQRRLQQLDQAAGNGGGDSGHHSPDLRERLAKLEGAFDWLKVALALVMAVVVGGFAFLGVQVTRTDGKVSALSDQVQALPERINANLRDLTKTLSDAITASKQTPPQVILMPAPGQTPQNPNPPAHNP